MYIIVSTHDLSELRTEINDYCNRGYRAVGDVRVAEKYNAFYILMRKKRWWEFWL